MSMDKAIEHGKDRRRPYRGSKRFDKTCRNNGACGWCRGNRTVKARRQLMRADEIEREWIDDFTESRRGGTVSAP